MLQEPLDCGSVQSSRLFRSCTYTELTLSKPLLALCTIGFNIKEIVRSAHRVHVYFSVLYGSQNKQLLLPDVTLTNFYSPEGMCLLGGLSYIFHCNHFVFKRPCHCSGSYSSTSHDEVWVQCRVCPHVICGRSSATGEGVFPSTSAPPPVSIIPPVFCYRLNTAVTRRTSAQSLETFKQNSFRSAVGTVLDRQLLAYCFSSFKSYTAVVNVPSYVLVAFI